MAIVYSLLSDGHEQKQKEIHYKKGENPAVPNSWDFKHEKQRNESVKQDGCATYIYENKHSTHLLRQIFGKKNTKVKVREEIN